MSERTNILNCVMPFIVLLSTGGMSAESSQKADFYVSTSGSDSWSGSLPEPNGEASDGPFATTGKARDAVRELKKRKSTDIAVLVRGGTYQLGKTVVFGLEDSGPSDKTITYAGAERGQDSFFSVSSV
jgi:hypothetical protein